MRVRALDEHGDVVRWCTISDKYKATTVYNRIKAGDADTFNGTIVRWVFIDNTERVVEEIKAPGYR